MDPKATEKPKNKAQVLEDIRCSKCAKLKAKAMLTLGSKVEIYCKRCKAFTTVAK